MNQITADWETYYDTTYSLSKMQTDAYVLDDMYQTMGVAVKVNDGVTEWFTGTEEETKAFLSSYDFDNSAVLCHHTLFDGFIFAQRFGIKPKLWMDTKSMATVLYPYLNSYSLANLAKTFGLQEKGTAVVTMLGRRRETMNPVEALDYGDYCINDVEITYAMGKMMLPLMPALELRLIDMTVRMFTEPQFVGNIPMLEQLYSDELARKIAVMDLAGTDKKTIMSNDKFAAELTNRGATPPTKISAKTGKESWAFAKTDEAFTALLEDEDPEVQALVAARLGVKTTIAETRALKMLETARRGKLPVYLNYWGAKTTGRYSGGNAINFQNLPARGPSAGIRNAIGVPPGHVMIVGDSSNIELRVAMAAARQDDLIELIIAGEDLYCNFAAKMFGRAITKADTKERLLGKIAMLSLQYGAGWRKFKEMVRQQSGAKLSDENAEGIVNLYRRVHHKIVDMWERFDTVILPEIKNGNQNMLAVEDYAWCLCTGKGYGVAGGPGVVYHELRREQMTDKYGRPGEQWVYTMGRKDVKLYGGKCVDGDTLVLTELGWKPLKSIRNERVHDGVDFVEHGGIVFSGVKDCVAVDGVLMTPEHKVLTDEGWKTALEKPRPHRPDLRHVDRTEDRWERWEKDAVGLPVCVREDSHESGLRHDQRGEARGNPELRVPHVSTYVGQGGKAWHEQPSGIRGVQVHGGPLRTAVASGVEKLRGAWHSGVRAVAGVVRELLGGHGADVPAPAYAGAHGQRVGVLAGELRVGDVRRTSEQQAQQRGTGETPQKKAVYDVINAGSRHRFVVLGAEGPFIVHNCFENYCQHVARQIVMWQTARINHRYPVALSVHDEAVCVVREEDRDDCVAYMTECLNMAPPWCRDDIPLACEVGYGYTYGEAK